MSLQVHKGSSGFFLDHRKSKVREIVPNAKYWFEDQKDAEREAMRIADLTGDAVLIVQCVSKVVPWHCH
jgi:nitrogen regulatory protein PII-like uncharacterized protein